MKSLARWWSTLFGEDGSDHEALPAAHQGHHGERVRVYVSHGPGQEQTIGYLEESDGRFRFMYAPEYLDKEDAVPISAFPELGKPYESDHLWPFFAVRIPPAHRPDVRELIESRHLSEESTLRRLVELSPRTVTNPYLLEMERAPRRAAG